MRSRYWYPKLISIYTLCVMVLILAMASPCAWGNGAREGSLWSPYLEWELENPTYSGNPFDLIANVTFIHKSGEEERTTEMFYDGEDTWKFRFTGTRVGEWTFITSSDDPDLNGRRGTVMIGPNPYAQGFLTHFGSKWGWIGTGKAFVPQLLMYESPDHYHKKTEKVEADIQMFMVEHGFTGFHVPSVAAGWFDINLCGKGYDRLSGDDPDPDPRTFEALELLITKTYAAGGMVHIWVWGDQSRKQTPNRWGKNGKVDERLQRYMAARLGPIPGWSMGYGFDLDEWVEPEEIHTWHDYMHEKLGWFHFLGGRPEGPNEGTDHSEYITWNKPLDYSSYEHHRPNYEVYIAALETLSGKPVMSEDRFRVRDRYSKDYTIEETRRGLYHSTLAGGVANIWGYVKPDYPSRGGSHPYPNKEQLRTYRYFFRNRFHRDIVRVRELTDGYALKRPTEQHYIFYKEVTDHIRMDLSDMKEAQPAIAVDTKKVYAEIEIGLLFPKNQTWQAPYLSDWALAIGHFPEASQERPSRNR